MIFFSQIITGEGSGRPGGGGGGGGGGGEIIHLLLDMGAVSKLTIAESTINY